MIKPRRKCNRKSYSFYELEPRPCRCSVFDQIQVFFILASFNLSGDYAVKPGQSYYKFVIIICAFCFLIKLSFEENFLKRFKTKRYKDFREMMDSKLKRTSVFLGHIGKCIRKVKYCDWRLPIILVLVFSLGWYCFSWNVLNN